MMKRVVFLLCAGICLLCFASSLAETVSLSAVVPSEHSITVTLGEYGAVKYGEQQFSETASITVQRFEPAQIDIMPDYGYKLSEIRVSSGENLTFEGTAILFSSVVEDVFVELSFVEIEWEEAAYTWSDDNGTVTATCVSKDDPTIVKTETALAVGTVTKEPTCTEMGVTTYTAEFNDPTFAAQSKEVENVDTLPHTPVTSPAIPATDTEDGTTKEICCSVCQTVLSAGQLINHKKQMLTPQQLSVIEDEAFKGTDFHQIILSENVVIIGHKAFASCPNLGVVAIPASVEEIASDAFAGDELVTLQVAADSYALQYALDNKIDFIIK